MALEPCDMRKGFNGLYGLVGERLEKIRALERSLSLLIGEFVGGPPLFEKLDVAFLLPFSLGIFGFRLGEKN